MRAGTGVLKGGLAMPGTCQHLAIGGNSEKYNERFRSLLHHSTPPCPPTPFLCFPLARQAASQPHDGRPPSRQGPAALAPHVRPRLEGNRRRRETLHLRAGGGGRLRVRSRRKG